MPRNVVTVVPRFTPFPWWRREQARILREVGQRHRPTPHDHGNGLKLDFSKRDDSSAARARVVGWLDEISPGWRRYVKVYPRV